MMISEPPLTKPLAQLNKLIPWIFAGVSLLGFTDAAYLTANHYLGVSLKCYFVHGCDVVTNSPYAVIFGIPVALLGSFYYLTMFILSVYCLDTGNAKILRFTSILTATGFLASIYFVSLQLCVIKQLCFYCMISAVTSTVLFIFGIIWLLADAKSKRE